MVINIFGIFLRSLNVEHLFKSSLKYFLFSSQVLFTEVVGYKPV